ncbi:hypothetical protein V6Z11_D11G386200, partial [Gossypium hirsutum]
MRIEIAEAWDSLLLAQVIRGSVLITQSILRKYIILPSLIIVKNIARMLLFQFPEWSEDLTDWNREMHVKCTYNGREPYELGETKKDSIISNKMIHKSSLQIQSMAWINYSLTEKKIKDLTKRTNTIKNQIQKILIIKEKKNEFLTQEINSSSNKISYQDKIVESAKKFWQIVKRRNIRLIRKFYFFIKFFIEKIYMDILLYIINIPRTNTQLFLESTKKMIENFIHNNEANQERITYVFYKLSQTQVISFYKFKPILQYHGMNEWKNWLRSRYQYDLVQNIWLKLVPRQWRNRVNQHYKRDLYAYGSPFQVNKRKFFNWRILHFCLRNKVDIESWVDTKSNPSNKKGNHFDWMGLNEEILSHPIPNLELWFFPEFVLLYNAYKVKPWIIPIKLLL